jgi:hypothetical protein
VQDESAGLVVAALDPQPGEDILDACAAPGGKALFIAARMRGQVCLSNDSQRSLTTQRVSCFNVMGRRAEDACGGTVGSALHEGHVTLRGSAWGVMQPIAKHACYDRSRSLCARRDEALPCPE